VSSFAGFYNTEILQDLNPFLAYTGSEINFFTSAPDGDQTKRFSRQIATSGCQFFAIDFPFTLKLKDKTLKKDRGGKTKVHQLACPAVSQTGMSCACPKRLALVTILLFMAFVVGQPCL